MQTGLAAGQLAQVVLRSGGGAVQPGRVLRVEPLADAVTEETLAKVVFEQLPTPLPALGELAEVTVGLPAVAAAPTIPNAAPRRGGGRVGGWHMEGDGLRFVPIRRGAADLEGNVQADEGLKEGARIVVYSEKVLNERSTIKVVERIAGATR